MLKFLEGKKTYISAALMVVLAGLKSLNYINEAEYQIVFTILGALGLASLRAAVNK